MDRGTFFGRGEEAAWRPALAGVVAAALATGAVRVFPGLKLEVLARGAALLAGVVGGTPVVRVEEGWLLATGARPAVVTEACSASGYFAMVVALLAWRSARRGSALVRAVGGAFVGALPLTLAINALRVAVLVQAHRWIIPRFPADYAAFLHLLTGVAVFLPALIGLNVWLEFHGNNRSVAR